MVIAMNTALINDEVDGEIGQTSQVYDNGRIVPGRVLCCEAAPARLYWIMETPQLSFE